MREIVLDTESTGLNAFKGDRIVEIGCVEIFNCIPTGKTYHVYINPEREVEPDAVQIHGLTNEFLADKPVFAEIVEGFLEFIGEEKLVIHNASFDMGFINAELARIGFPALPANRAIDTLEMARRKFFGAPASLDALCKRFGIDTSARTLHGALLDAELLAEVYLELRGGRQTRLDMNAAGNQTENASEAEAATEQRTFLKPRPHQPTAEELAAHEAFLKQIKAPLWGRVKAE